MKTISMRVDESDEIDREIGRLLRARRLDLGLTQNEVGAALRLSYQQIQKFEKGIIHISVFNLSRLAAVLRCPLTTLLPSSSCEKTPSPQAGSLTLQRYMDLACTRDGRRLLLPADRLPPDRLRAVAKLAELLAEEHHPAAENPAQPATRPGLP